MSILKINEFLSCIQWNIMNEKYSIFKDVKWEKRLKIILNIITDYDIVFLQEVSLDDFDNEFKSLFEKYNYFRHCVCKKRSNFMGNITLWKKDIKMTRVFSNSCSLITNLNNILFVNLHLRAGMKTNKEFREKQISSIFNIIQKIDYNIPVVITGDFNDENIPLLLKNEYKRLFKENIRTCLTCSNLFDFDHVFFKGNVIVNYILKYNNIISDKVSDHLPVPFKIFFKL